VTRLNDDVFSELEIPEPESVWYEGAGGTKVHAWLYRPPVTAPGGKHPLILLVHGGPQGAWSDGWSYRWNPPLWAAQGYVVIAPNPRGSTGFGQKFTDEISGDWGGKVFVDVMKAVDYAQTLPYVDPQRTAAAGASFGGYMVNWILGHAGNRFQALVSHDGVYNFESMYGSTDEVWFDEWEHGGTPWDKPDEYRTFSPPCLRQKLPHTHAGDPRRPGLQDPEHGGDAAVHRTPASGSTVEVSLLSRRKPLGVETREQ
jgi:dipeptidyl aminopeptidase/acylaminoacyl peptidase